MALAATEEAVFLAVRANSPAPVVVQRPRSAKLIVKNIRKNASVAVMEIVVAVTAAVHKVVFRLLRV